jgi:hypothetical protein
MESPPTVRRQTGTFTAVGEDGRAYTVHVYTWFTRSYGAGGVPAVVEGRRELVTADGRGVTRLARGHYLIEPNGVALQSADPAAP